jgi:hypothetical protein
MPNCTESGMACTLSGSRCKVHKGEAHQDCHCNTSSKRCGKGPAKGGVASTSKQVKKTKKTPTPSPPKQQQTKSNSKSKGKGPLIKKTPKPEPKPVETPDLLSELAKKDRKDILIWMEKNMNLVQLRGCLDSGDVETEAAKVIQRLVRRRQQKKVVGEKVKKERAATKLQAVVRGRQARARVTKETKERAEAAKIIQRAFRKQLEAKAEEKLVVKIESLLSQKYINKKDLRKMCKYTNTEHDKKDSIDKLFKKCFTKEQRKMYKGPREHNNELVYKKRSS